MGKQQQPRQRGLVGSLLSLVLLPLTICIALVRIVFHGLMSLDRKPSPRTTPYNRPPSPLGAPPARPPSPSPQPQLFGYPRSFVVIAAVVIVIAGIFGGAVLTQGLGLGQAGAVVATDTPFPTFVPTVAPTATATPRGPHLINTPTLGGTAAEWTSAYGQPDTSGRYARYSVTTPEGDQIVLCFCDVQPGTDGQQRDARVGISAQPGVSLTAQALATLLPNYLPPDAKHVRDFTDPQIGLIHLYSSADLAATFPASAFSDQGGAPGTFIVACNQPGAPGPGCDVLLGD